MHELLHFDGCLQLLLCQDLLIYLENTKNVIYAYTDLYIFVDEHIFIFKQLNGKKKEKLLNKVVIFILFVHKVFSLLHNIKVEPLKSHGLFKQCPYYLSGPWMW